MKSFVSLFTALALFASLLVFSDAASAAALSAIKMCATVIIPSLFPFFVATGLLSGLGLMRRLSVRLAPLCSKLFGVSGNGAAAFIIGVTAGYPLGAAYIAEICRNGEISQREAQSLAVFCNNSGPAFIIGAVGGAVFHSAAVGVFSYAVHIIAAIAGGIILSQNSPSCMPSSSKITALPFSSALTEAVKKAVDACLSVSGFIIAFTVIIGILDAYGIIMPAAAGISALSGSELSFARALICGFLELGSGIAAMSCLDIAPHNLALAAFILSWGSVSVHFQSFAMLGEIKINAVRYIAGRLMIAVIAACIAFVGAVPFC